MQLLLGVFATLIFVTGQAKLAASALALAFVLLALFASFAAWKWGARSLTEIDVRDILVGFWYGGPPPAPASEVAASAGGHAQDRLVDGEIDDAHHHPHHDDHHGFQPRQDHLDPGVDQPVVEGPGLFKNPV